MTSLEDSVGAINLDRFAVDVDVELIVEGLRGAESAEVLIEEGTFGADCVDSFCEHVVVYGFELFSEC